MRIETLRRLFVRLIIVIALAAARPAVAGCEYCASFLGGTWPACITATYGTPGGVTNCHLVYQVSVGFPSGVSLGATCVEEGNFCPEFYGTGMPPEDLQPYNQIVCIFRDASNQCVW
jgi:hypothetical protein